MGALGLRHARERIYIPENTEHPHPSVMIAHTHTHTHSLFLTHTFDRLFNKNQAKIGSARTSLLAFLSPKHTYPKGAELAV